MAPPYAIPARALNTIVTFRVPPFKTSKRATDQKSCCSAVHHLHDGPQVRRQRL